MGSRFDFQNIRFALLWLTFILLSGCATAPQQPPCASDRLNLPDCPPAEAMDDSVVRSQQHERRWIRPDELEVDPLKFGMEAYIPVHQAQMRIVGTSNSDSVRSLALKIWLIDHAEHTLDAVYYIFARDLVGYSVLGALCDAVKRGVDVRLMVDSLGSYNTTHSELKALENCAINAGFVRNSKGEVTTTKARAQVVVFNAISKLFVNFNRRSHDKLLVADGAYPDKAWAMTGGRNISLAYYGLNEDGTRDPSAYKDLEILVRPAPGLTAEDSISLISEYYYSLLFSYKRNKRLSSVWAYQGQLDKFDASLAKLRAMDEFQQAYAEMPAFVSELRSGKVLLAHELGNLENKNVVGAYDENLKRNPNSIMSVMEQIGNATDNKGVIRVVSPYFFVSRYERKDGSVYFDDIDEIEKWLSDHPENSLEIVTNSILTSGNFFAQAIVDIDTAPRLLLDEEFEERWRGEELEDGEFNSELVESEAFKEMVNNPRVKIYQAGRSDSILLGGDVHYSKVHAKFVIGSDNIGFVGTTNFDDRSKLYNNEMGYFFQSDQLVEDLKAEFELLKSQSYLWGSPEWLQMREQVRDAGGSKAKALKKQRSTFRRLYAYGLHWLF